LYLDSGGHNSEARYEALQLLNNPLQLERVGLAQTGFIMTNRSSPAGHCTNLKDQVPGSVKRDASSADVPLSKKNETMLLSLQHFPGIENGASAENGNHVDPFGK
jgi:hypothetical protein